MEKYNGSIRLGVNFDVSELDKTEAQLKRIVDLLEFINKPRHINVIDGEGNLRLVIGPLSIEAGSVSVKNATIQNAIIQNAIYSANVFKVFKGAESENVSGNKDINEEVRELKESLTSLKETLGAQIKNTNANLAELSDCVKFNFLSASRKSQ